MKRTFKFVAMLLMGVVSMGFTSCSDDDTPTTDNTVSASLMQNTAQTYLNDVVYPTYTDLANLAQTLYEKCSAAYTSAKAGTLTDAQINEACEAFKNARREWERSEAFLYGAATDNEIDPHIDSWPLDKDQMEQALNDASVIEGVNGSNPAKFVYEENSNFDSVLGFHGLEFVLFRDGAVRKASAFAANDTYEGMTSVKGIDELAFAAAVSADIRNMTFLLEYGWLGTAVASAHQTQLNAAGWVVDGTQYAGLSSFRLPYGTILLNATQSNAYFNTWQETMENILKGGCSNICQEVYTQKLGQAYRCATNSGMEDDAPDYIESPHSKRSFVDYQDNIYSIKNSLYGTRNIDATSPVANSLMSIMRDYNYSRYNNLLSALNGAIAALETAKNSGKAFIDAPGDPQVKTCIDAVNTLDDELNLAASWFRSLKVQ